MYRFRLVTYNIHRAKGMDWQIRPARIIEILREIGGDIIALQEVVADHVDYIVDNLEANHVFGKTDEVHGHEYGNLTLTRFPITLVEKFDISVPHRTRRACVRTDLALGNGTGRPVPPVHFFHVHLGTSYFERRRQALKLLSPGILANRQMQGPRLVAGDFNEWTRGLVTRFLSAQLQSADIHGHLQRRRTYPGVLPFWHLDHIYYDPELRLESLALHRTPRTMMASDHLPLVADFVLVE